MDTSGEQHLKIEHNIYKRRLNLDGKPIEDPKKEGNSTCHCQFLSGYSIELVKSSQDSKYLVLFIMDYAFN